MKSAHEREQLIKDINVQLNQAYDITKLNNLLSLLAVKISTVKPNNLTPQT